MDIDRSVIGQWGPTTTMHVELGKVREFARAIKDDAPMFKQGEVLPPTFLMTVQHWIEPTAGGMRPGVKLDMRRVLHGEQEFEYVKPIRAGDVLSVRSCIKNVFEKPGARGGTMLFVVSESEYKNQRGEIVAYTRSTVIQTEGAVKKE